MWPRPERVPSVQAFPASSFRFYLVAARTREGMTKARDVLRRPVLSLVDSLGVMIVSRSVSS